MLLLRISVLVVLCLSYTTIDANGCQTGNHIYNYIHLPSDIIRFSVNTSLDFNTTEGHFLLTSNFSQSPFYFNITVRNDGSNKFKIKSTCDFNNSIEFEPTEVNVHKVTISYEKGYIMIKHIDGSTIAKSPQKTFMPRYFWYNRNIQISGCIIGLDEQCSAEYSVNTITQSLEVNCALTECVWNIDDRKDQFEKCDTNCEHKIANCTDYLAKYETNDKAKVSPATGTPIPALGTPTPVIGTHITASGTHITMNAKKTEMQSGDRTEQISTADMDQSENSKTIGNYIVGDSNTGSSLTTVATTAIESDDTFVNFWYQLITAKYTEYCNTSLSQETNTTNVKETWTPWYDRDNPSGTGDWETVSNLLSEHPATMCAKPIGIECQTTAGQPYTSTNDTVTCYPSNGLVCEQAENGYSCADYRVRFLCSGLDDQCSAMYYETIAAQSSEEKCALTECIWKINNEVRLFKECNANCTHTIRKCIGFPSQNNDNPTAATGTSLLMNTDKNVQNQNRVVLTTAEPQNLLWQYNTADQSKTVTTTGVEVREGSGPSLTTETTVIENNDTSDRLLQQLITAMYTEYCNSSFGLKTTTVTGLTDVRNTEVRSTENVGKTDDILEPGIHWTSGIILLIAFTGAGVGTFVIGSMFVLHGLIHDVLQPRKGRKVSPEEAASYK
ncbi:uncharacterized protein LOC117116913 isoform X1 [Anneissia japonica]|uniref:uncharacterized protein LOC117116913 isoform X1 n=1 Tax=Anneissia japonica TaxID=1529436 RepID=UPI00142556DC|nr:uncharacterized protein LOC117116913 isoform X1 [Anneissia japonica]